MPHRNKTESDPLTKEKQEVTRQFRAGLQQLGWRPWPRSETFSKTTRVSEIVVTMADDSHGGWYFNVLHFKAVEVESIFCIKGNPPLEELLTWLEHDLPLLLFEP